MISIKKFENIFGISQLKGADDLSKINVIYAPNGTAKTSIADALKHISDKEIGKIKDVYGVTSEPCFDINVDGKSCTEKNLIDFKVIKYSGDEFKFLYDCSNVVLSNCVIAKMKEEFDVIENSKNYIKKIIEDRFPKSKTQTKGLKTALAVLANVSDYDDKDLFIKLIKRIDFDVETLSINIDENIFINLLTEKAKAACKTEEVITGVKDYFEEINKIISEEGRNVIFDNKFTLDNLIDFKESADKTGFFNDENPIRKLYIDGKIVGKEEIEQIIKIEKDRIFDTPEAKDKFEKIKKGLGKQNKVIQIFSNNPSLILELNDYEKLASKIFITFYNDSKEILKKEKQKILEAQEKIRNIVDVTDPTDQEIKIIWSKFKSRFKFKKFDLRIDNEFNAMIGNEVPVFSKYIPGTNEKITDPKIYRLSTGEIRTFNLINFIITIESLRKNNEEITIVLDDAVDSFDYKNKYGLIDYLCEIKNDPNIQLIILTHNFDFYRTSILALGKSQCNKYFAYKNLDNVITFYSTKNKHHHYYLEISNFNNWKNNPSIEKYIALIPFVRNLAQLKTSGKNSEVKYIDSFFHYDSSLDNKKMSDLKKIFEGQIENVNFPKNIDENELFLDVLSNLSKKIIESENVKEEDLENKIVMGFYIRIFLEKFLYKTIQKNGGQIPNEENIYMKTQSLIENASRYLTIEEKEKVTEANVIAPSYVHANSFMYEPLIDVGCSELIDVVSWLREKIDRLEVHQ